MADRTDVARVVFGSTVTARVREADETTQMLGGEKLSTIQRGSRRHAQLKADGRALLAAQEEVLAAFDNLQPQAALRTDYVLISRAAFEQLKDAISTLAAKQSIKRVS